MSEVRDTQAAIAASATPRLLERVSWGAILAGALCALAILTVLNLFGVAAGLYVIDAEDAALGAGAAATTTGVWYIVSSLLALFAGGFISAKLTGNPDRLIAGMHGAAVWAVATLLAVWMVTAAASAAFTGAAGLVSRAAQGVGAASEPTINALDPAIDFAGQALAEELQAQGVKVSPQELRQEVSVVLNQAISPAERQELVQLAQNAAVNAAQNPDAARAEYRSFINRAFGTGGVINQQDVDQAVEALSNRTGASEAQIRNVVDRWQAQFTAGPGLEAQITQLQREAAQATAQTASAIGDTALWTGLGLLLALAAAVGGGVLGHAHLAGAPFAQGRREAPLRP